MESHDLGKRVLGALGAVQDSQDALNEEVKGWRSDLSQLRDDVRENREERIRMRAELDALHGRVGEPAPLTGQVRENRDQRLQWAAVAAVLLVGAGLLAQSGSCRSRLRGEAPVVHDEARAAADDDIDPPVPPNDDGDQDAAKKDPEDAPDVEIVDEHDGRP